MDNEGTMSRENPNTEVATGSDDPQPSTVSCLDVVRNAFSLNNALRV